MNGTLDLSGKTGKALKLRRNLLEGGLFYNFSVTVIAEDEGMNGTAFIVIKVLEHGLLARVVADKITVGTERPIILDARLSEDKDKKQGEMKVKLLLGFRNHTNNNAFVMGPNWWVTMNILCVTSQNCHCIANHTTVGEPVCTF